MRKLLIILVLLLMNGSSVQAAQTVHTDEASYLAALSAAGYGLLQESFEDDAAWGAVRTTIANGTKVAASVSNLGVTWTPNGPGSGITTGNGPARTGSWGVFELPHGDYSDPANPIRDGFVGTAASTIFGVGGWFNAQGTSAQVVFMLDGSTLVDFGNVALGSQHQFLGVVDTLGFLSFEIMETEGTAGDQNLVFADDFSLALVGSGSCGNGTLELGEQCDDGGTASGDCCSSTCTFESVICDDGDACTTNDACAAGSCVGGTAPSCDDGNQCTDDSCDPAAGCVNTANTAACNDANACTTGDTCSSGLCVGGAPPDCNDSNVCTDDSCDLASGCTNAANTASCDDGNACTSADSCSGGICAGGAPPNCDDGNQCTDDSCAPVSGCANVNDDTNLCSNGNASDNPDACVAGVCLGTGGCQGSDANCDDTNPCTNDTCLPSGACDHLNNTSPCDDGDACTTSDTCAAGLCIGGAPPNCDDGNVCSDDSCDPVSGCTNAANTAPCDDGDACTTADTCGGGVCTGGPLTICDDANLCTDDFCDSISGCLNAANSSPCDDGDACTSGDVCSNGSCHSGALTSCDDANPCTADSCDTVAGCQNVATTGPCDDGDACTTADSCVAGICQGDLMAGCSCPVSPATGCLTALKSQISLRDKSNDSKDALKWKWRKGADFLHADLGDPVNTTIYSLCVYDSVASQSSLATSVVLLPNPSWTDRNPLGFTYSDKTALEDGIRTLRVRPGLRGWSKAQIRATGEHLPLPTPVSASTFFSQDTEVVVQMFNGEGVCWTSTFTTAETKKNTERKFKARAN